jgi:hypothetical protein
MKKAILITRCVRKLEGCNEYLFSFHGHYRGHYVNSIQGLVTSQLQQPKIGHEYVIYVEELKMIKKTLFVKCLKIKNLMEMDFKF